LVLAAVKNAKTEEQKLAAERTRFGTMMVHEIKFRYARGSKEPMETVLAFGYGRDDCQVFNYWDPDYPLAVSSEQVKSLLLRRGDALLAVLCTWNPKPETVTLTLDTEALGLTPKAATDAESGEALGIKGGKTLTVPLDGYGVRILRLE
ncbi:MAG: glycoside hydrolase domain-containing protein, partial [Planctomycetota bacterium]